MTNDEMRKEAMRLVTRKLLDKEWFSGVCMDSFDPTKSLEENVDRLTLDTIYDAPNRGL